MIVLLSMLYHNAFPDARRDLSRPFSLDRAQIVLVRIQRLRRSSRVYAESMRSFLLFVMFASLVVLATLFCAGAQQPAPSSNLVQITMIATGKASAPVADLRAEEFSVKDNGKQQKIVAFEKLTAKEGGSVGADPTKSVLNNIVVLDALNTIFSDRPSVRLELVRILGELTTADGLTFLLLKDNLTVLHDFSASGPSIIRKLAGQGVKDLSSPNATPDPYSWVFGSDGGFGQLFTPTALLERARLTASLRTLQTIAVNMGKRPGRKNLIWIATHFPFLIGHDQTGFMEQSGDPTGSSDGIPSGELRSKGVNREPDVRSEFTKDKEMAGRMINSANLTVYPIDARSLATGTSLLSDTGQLKDMARFTGGVAYPGRSDVAKALHEAIADNSVTYVLSYNAPDLKPDGQFHPLKVETTRKDVKLRFREGYWAPTAASR
jgi:VWFA-related protein